MKQKDIAAIIIVIAISGVISFFVARALFVSSKDRRVEAEIVSPVTTDFVRPNTKYFNENAINPTPKIQIGNSANPSPYSGQ